MNKKTLNVFTYSLFFVSIMVIACNVEGLEPFSDMAWIPEGKFVMGTNACTYMWNENITYIANEQDDCKGSREYPRHTVYIDGFYIDKHEVTMREYLDCVKAGKCLETKYVKRKGFAYSNILPTHPTRVSHGRMQ